jgi:hypothetical protein
MIKTYAYELAEAAVQLSHYPLALASLNMLGQNVVPDYLIVNICKHLERCRDLCPSLGMKSTVLRVNRLLESRQHWSNNQLAMDLKEISIQILDDLSETYFLHVPVARMEFYDRPWCSEKVRPHFP